ncbi:hypothetical protein D3C73_1148320 [compost metagenome]
MRVSGQAGAIPAVREVKRNIEFCAFVKPGYLRAALRWIVGMHPALKRCAAVKPNIRIIIVWRPMVVTYQQLQPRRDRRNGLLRYIVTVINLDIAGCNNAVIR